VDTDSTPDQRSDSARVPLLEARNLTLWRGDRCLFENLSFELAAGELVHLRGPNGCGKTSLLRVICGLTLPETGEVLWRNTKVLSSRTDFHAEMSYVGHRESLKAELSAEENLIHDLGLRRDLESGAVQDALAKVQLQNAMSIPSRSLSAGQRRRASLARCLASKSRLWILDEPYTNLDVAGRLLVDSMMTNHLRQDGIVLLVAHQDHGVDHHTIKQLEMD
jgi:heme exporter protein A